MTAKTGTRLAGLLVGGLGAALLLSVGGHSANRAEAKSARSSSSYASKVTPWAAMDIANATMHGKVISATYASEGNTWSYDVIIVKDGALSEVEVDATTGKADKPESVTPEGEAKEMADDLNKALGKTTSSSAEKAGNEKD